MDIKAENIVARKSPISKRLKEARLESGISQKQLGISAGIDEFVASSRMNQYETGKHSPDFVILQQIAKVLKLPVSYFYTPDNELAALIKGYGRLTTPKKEQLIRFFEKLQG